MACPNIFTSDQQEKHPDLKLGWNLDTDMPG